MCIICVIILKRTLPSAADTDRYNEGNLLVREAVKKSKGHLVVLQCTEQLCPSPLMNYDSCWLAETALLHILPAPPPSLWYKLKQKAGLCGEKTS